MYNLLLTFQFLEHMAFNNDERKNILINFTLKLQYEIAPIIV